MKIGLLGGTFDPIHIGHLIIAECILDKLQLDRIVFIPAGDPPHKEIIKISPIKQRLEMVRLAIKDHSKFQISEFESNKHGKSYSVETLQEFSKFKSPSKLFWIIGMDSLIDLPNWYHPDEIFRLSQVVVYPRINYSIDSSEEQYREQIILFDAPQIQISASDLRKRVSNSMSIRYMVPTEVENYIYTNGLYKNC